MTITSIIQSVTRQIDGCEIGADGDGVSVAAGVTVEGLIAGGIYGAGSSQSAVLLGTARGGLSGIIMGGHQVASTGNSVYVGEGALAWGQSYGVLMYGADNVLANDGRIEGASAGVFLVTRGDSALHNGGDIVSLGIGVLVDDAGDGASFATAFVNEGTVTSGGTAYQGTGHVDRVANTGSITGAVRLAGGKDRYDGLDGSVTGPVFGGGGNDAFVAGALADDFRGRDGIDTLDFRGAAALRVSLASDTGTGAASGDSYRGFENVVGSDLGADTIIGNATANGLQGLRGADRIEGRGGDDILSGGRGSDSLWGGAGHDTFAFGSAAQGGDHILDWNGAEDRVRIDARGFGLSEPDDPVTLAQGRFASGPTNAAQDAGDRFVFRTGDLTLWFDRDGAGVAQAVLIADLQAGAVLTAADILLV